MVVTTVIVRLHIFLDVIQYATCSMNPMSPKNESLNGFLLVSPPLYTLCVYTWAIKIFPYLILTPFYSL